MQDKQSGNFDDKNRTVESNNNIAHSFHSESFGTRRSSCTERFRCTHVRLGGASLLDFGNESEKLILLTKNEKILILDNRKRIIGI